MDWEEAAYKYYRRTFAHERRLSSLPNEWQRELVALMLMGREVWNGGYLQLLANCGREAYVYASQALKVIGAQQMADIIDGCQALVDEHVPCEGMTRDELAWLAASPIIDREGRRIKEAGSVLPEPILARLSELSWELMRYPDDVAELAERHFRPLIDGDDHGPAPRRS